MRDGPNLPALVGSRICHDLISPIGAIGNGLELLSLSGLGHSAEMELITESVENASARIRFFRVAFGAAGSGQRLAGAEVRGILRAIARGGRLRFDWRVEEDALRDEVQCVFLAIQCLESALPAGGTVIVTRDGADWQVQAEAATVRMEAGLWSALDGGRAQPGLSSAHVQFLLLPAMLASLGRRAAVETDEAGLILRF